MVTQLGIDLLVATLAGVASGLILNAIHTRAADGETEPRSGRSWQPNPDDRVAESTTQRETVVIGTRSHDNDDASTVMIVCGIGVLATTAAYLRYFDALLIAIAVSVAFTCALALTTMTIGSRRGLRLPSRDWVRATLWGLGIALAAWSVWLLAHPTSETLSQLLSRSSESGQWPEFEDILANDLEAVFHMLGYASSVALCVVLVCSMAGSVADVNLRYGNSGAKFWTAISRLRISIGALAIAIAFLGTMSVTLATGFAHDRISEWSDQSVPDSDRMQDGDRPPSRPPGPQHKAPAAR